MLSVTGGGILNKVVSIIIFLVGTINLINCIYRGYDIVQTGIFVALLYVLSGLIYFLKNNILFSIALLSFGVLLTVLNEDIQNFTGSIFIASSFLLTPNTPYGIFLILSTIISISIKSNIHNIPFNSSMNMMLAYMIVYLILYFVAYRKSILLEKKIDILNKEIESLNKEIESLKENPPEKLKNIDLINITEEDKGMLKLFCRGVSYEKISQFMGLNNAHDTVRRKITGLRNKYKKKTDAEFVKWLYDSV